MKIEIIHRAQKQIRRIKQGNPNRAHQIVEIIYRIGQNPYLKGTLKLSGFEEYRFRVGNFRILYRIDLGRKLITIVDILDRKDAYKNI